VSSEQRGSGEKQTTMSTIEYTAELKELNTRARMMRDAARQGASVIILMQLGLRLLNAEQAAARAMGLFAHKGVQ
jgi:hypothetical protein